ncbi:MAG: SurA N-terminal domain-containing protein, partial [Gammaproteobacteria bacterium]|nr:SurA N-terminal domain-containing protein [Gammaproteobacteria bacterium]
MLQSIRDRAQGVFVWLVIGAIVISFALFGISNYFSGGVDQTKVATVNGEDISVNDYRLAFVEEQSRMRQMFGEGFDIDQFEDQIKKSALQRSIERTVLSISATDSGMFVSDQQLAGRVHEIPNFQQDGKFSKSLYEQTLRQNSQSVAGFEHRLRRDLILQQFALGLSSSAFATNNDIKNTYLLEQQERQIGYMTVAANSFTKDINIDDAAVKDYYDKNQGQYQTQEQVSVSYLELNVNDLTGGIEVSDDEVEEYFEEQQERFMTGEERKARHILISVDDKTSDADAKKKINDLHAKIQSGESFEELAKKHSQDPGSAEQGGDLGFFGKGIMDKVFEDTAFALNKGEISKPIRSEFGYHIIKLEEIKAGKGKNLGDVRDELLKELKRSKAERVYAEKAEKLVNLTYENPESLEPAADELG